MVINKKFVRRKGHGGESRKRRKTLIEDKLLKTRKNMGERRGEGGKEVRRGPKGHKIGWREGNGQRGERRGVWGRDGEKS